MRSSVWSANSGGPLALDLELHRVPETMPADERAQREVLNRLRTHIICFIIDRCFCINLGKPFMIPEEDVSMLPYLAQCGSRSLSFQMIRNAATQFLGWKYSLGSDNYIVSLVELLRIMTRFVELSNPAMNSSNASRDVRYGTTRSTIVY